MQKPIRVALAQMTCSPDPGLNIDKVLDTIKLAAEKQVDVLCLQELFRTPYFCQVEDFDRFDLAETIPGPTTEVLCQAARKANIVLVASLFEKRTAGIYHNTAVVIDRKGQISGKYRKMHIPDDPLYYEKFYFTPGDLGFMSHSTDKGRIGVLVCWDQWFPEGARLTALAGAEIIFYPTAIGWIDGENAETNAAQHAAWETVQRGHAVANGTFVAAVNRVGREGNLTFWGQSFVSDPFGRIIAKAPSDREQLLVVDCDLSLVEQTRRHWPFLRDRRIDAYGKLTGRYSDEG